MLKNLKIYVENASLVFMPEEEPNTFPYQYSFENDIFTILPINNEVIEPFQFALIDVTDENGNPYAPEQLYALIEQYEGYGSTGTKDVGGEDVITTGFATCGFTGDIFEVETTDKIAIKTPIYETESATIHIKTSHVDYSPELEQIIIENTSSEDRISKLKISNGGNIEIDVSHRLDIIQQRNDNSANIYLDLIGGIGLDATGLTGSSTVTIEEDKIQLNTIALFLGSLPTYADDAAAGVGLLTQDQVYKTATGELRIKL